MFAKLFRKRLPAYTEREVTFEILDLLLKMGKKGRVNLYNGTINGLRNAQADSSSDVYIVEVLNPPERSAILRFSEYAEKLKQSFKKRGEDRG